MKKLIVIITILTSSTFIFSQVNFGVKAGINTYDVHEELFESNFKDFSLTVKEAQYGFHAGVFLRAKLGPILLQPELVFNSDNVDYTFDQDGIGQTIVNQKYSALDMPVLAGLKIGPLRVMGGPVGHYHLNSITNLESEIKTKTFSDKLTLGWQIGGGFDLKKITIDVRYEANDSKIGNNLSIGGQEIAFGQNRNRIVASLGYKF